MTIKLRNIFVGVTALLGVLCITSGSIMPSFAKDGKNIVKLKVTQKRVAKAKTTELKLKEITKEINEPLSVDVKDYISNLDEIDSKMLDDLKLDTSAINISEAGTYIYTITFKKKTYNGNIIVKEKEITLENLTLKNLTLLVGTNIPTDLNSYITETIPEEIKDQIKLDITSVNTKVAGTYQYTIAYNGKLYTGSITVYAPQPAPTPAISLSISCTTNAKANTDVLLKTVSCNVLNNGNNVSGSVTLDITKKSTVHVGTTNLKENVSGTVNYNGSNYNNINGTLTINITE